MISSLACSAEAIIVLGAEGNVVEAALFVIGEVGSCRTKLASVINGILSRAAGVLFANGSVVSQHIIGLAFSAGRIEIFKTGRNVIVAALFVNGQVEIDIAHRAILLININSLTVGNGHTVLASRIWNLVVTAFRAGVVDLSLAIRNLRVAILFVDRKHEGFDAGQTRVIAVSRTVGNIGVAF
jgi:energy-coupling factor transporter ATP-binding protein EcfA2